MTRFAGHKDITNFIQRNTGADKIGAAGMNAYADQASAAYAQDAKVTISGVMGDARVQAADAMGDAHMAASASQANAGLFGDVMSGVRGFAGAGFESGAFGKFNYGQTRLGAGGGEVGGIGTLGPNYGFQQ